LDIYLTKEFLKLLQEMEYAPVNYAEFIKSLTKFVSVKDDLEDQQVSAGGFRLRPELSGETIGTQRKRHSGLQAAYHETSQQDKSIRNYRKMVTDQKVNDQMIFKTKEIKDVLFFDRDNETVPLFSHNTEDMVTGKHGESDLSLTYNIEQRLQREQLAAALRKLDGGSISIDDFQNLVYSIGIDVPEKFLADVRRDFAAGKLDVRKYMKILDSNIFKAASIESHLNDDSSEVALKKFRHNIFRKGFETLQNLIMAFKDFDENGDEKLTFAEFKNGCKRLNLLSNLSDMGLRSLFNRFDKNGDGFLQYEEFIEAIRGEVSTERKQIIRKAFQKLDIHSTGKVPLDFVGEKFNPEGHPQFINGEKQAHEVTTEFLRWFLSREVKYPIILLVRRSPFSIDFRNGCLRFFL
jgi:Ca2+-binding EF-hand superfamily protein